MMTNPAATPFEEIVWDIETNGLLPSQVGPAFAMDRIHCIGIKCLNTGQAISYVNNDERDDLAQGAALISRAKRIVGHNIIGFDLPAMKLIFPDFEVEGSIVDTLVMARMVFADIKDSDFRLSAKGQLEGKLIGTQGLEAWGQRLGLHKGDYKAAREAELKEAHRAAGLPAPTPEELHAFVWGSWNEPMNDYMMLDLDVNDLLYRKITEHNWDHEAVVLEHQVHSLMMQQETNGFLFNVEKARVLESELRTQHEALTKAAIAEIGQWYRPCKTRVDHANEALGENPDRRVWGEVAVAKTTLNRVKGNNAAIKAGEYGKLQASQWAGGISVPVELKQFNPGSRPQIIDRLMTLYGWEPKDLTDSGKSFRVDDEILRVIATDIPIAGTLAEVFYMTKRLGQIADGQNGWLKLVRADGRIHGRVNVGGTVSGRATHAAPNISQVPGVNPVEFKAKDVHDPESVALAKAEGQSFLDKMAPQLNAWGEPIIVSAKWKEKTGEKAEWSIVTRGRTGGYGYDCRELFEVPEGYTLVGTDLSGIEFRCLANLTFPWDNGEMVDVVLNGDIHQKNADLTGISRGLAKRLLYACMYGGGDEKLGSIIEPFSNPTRQKAVGADARRKLMAAMPSLNQAIREIHREMRKNGGTIRGLDGRRLYTRSKHSALNLRLQSDGAIIAKKWCVITDEMFADLGWEHNIEAEYAFMSWSHDETQIAVRNDLVEQALAITVAAAPLAGQHFNFNCPVAAEAKQGRTWAMTH